MGAKRKNAKKRIHRLNAKVAKEQKKSMTEF